MRRPIGGIAVAFLMLLPLSACSDSEPEKPSAAVRDQTPVEPAWTLDLDLVSRPRVADGVAVVLVRDKGDSLSVVAIDAAKGEQLWRQPWSPGARPIGYVMRPVLTEASDGRSVTVFSVPPKDLKATSPDMWTLPLSVRDVRTGEELHRTRRVDLTTDLQQCDDEIDICFTERGKGGQRLDVSTGRLAPDPDGAPDGARQIGRSGLFSTNDRPSEKLGVRREDEVVWSAPLEDVIGAPGTTDLGWTVRHDAGADRYVASIGYLPKDQFERAKARRSYTVDMSQWPLAAFDGRTGENLWTVMGASVSCFGIDQDEPTVRCVHEGIQNYSDGGDLQRVTNARSRLEGFDPSTGKATWSVRVADAEADKVIRNVDRPYAGEDAVLLPTPDGDVVVDLATGETEPAAAGDLFACYDKAEDITYAMPYFINDQPRYDRSPERMVRACTTTGGEADAYSVRAVQDAGAHDDDDESVHVVGTADGLLGFVLD